MPAIRSAALTAAMIAVAAVLGILVARGGYMAIAAIALGCALPLLILVSALGYWAVSVWLIVGAVAYPFLRYPQTHAILTFDRLWIVAMVVLAVTAGLTRRSDPSRRLWVILLWMIAAFGLRALFNPSENRYALQIWFDTLVLPAILFFVVRDRVRTSEQLQRIAGVFAATGLLLGLIAIGQRIFGFELASLSGGSVLRDPTVGVRVSGPYPQANVLALTLLMCFAVSLYWVQATHRTASPIALLVLVCELAGIGLTFFRGAWIAAAAVLILSLGLRPKCHARLVGLTALVATLGAVAFTQVSDSSGLGNRIQDTRNISGRFATYSQGFKVFESSPLLGVGIAQFSVAQENLETSSVRGVESVATAHNSFLNVLGEQGIFGFAPFLALSWAIWRLVRAFRLNARERSDILFGAAAAGAAVGYLIMSMELTTLLSATSNSFFAIVLGLVAARLDAIHRTRTPITTRSEPITAGARS